MRAATLGAGESSTCGRCTDELAQLTSIDLRLESAAIRSVQDWGVWESCVGDLFSRLVDGPVHVVVFDASAGRYLQMQLGHGRGRVEVSTSTTLSNDGANVELIAKILIDSGFAAPDRSPGPVWSSPNWSLELDPVPALLLADFVTSVFRDLMLVDTADITISGFAVDRPCARCHWDAA